MKSLVFWNRLFFVCVWLSNLFWSLAATVVIVVGLTTRLSMSMFLASFLAVGLIWLMWSTDFHKPSFWQLH